MELISNASLTYDVAGLNGFNASCSIDCSASLLIRQLHHVTPYWIKEKGIAEGSVFRIQMKCVADVEAGTSISTSYLSNLSHNSDNLPEISRVALTYRNGDLAVLGYGHCVRFKTIDDISSKSSMMAPSIISIGGNNFDDKDDTKCCGWVVPVIEVRSQSTSNVSSSDGNTLWPHTILSVNIVAGNELYHQLNHAKEILSNLLWDFKPNLSIPHRIPPLVQSMKDTGMSESEYHCAVEEALSLMKNNELQKVVFAAKKTGVLQSPVDAAALLLTVANGNRADEAKRYTFFFAPDGLKEEVFISLSPERLCLVQGNQIATEALAGTYPRSYIDEGGTLDDKTCREHGSVSSYVCSMLASLGGEPRVLDREVLLMKDVAHLRQVISGYSTDLHPTGAGLLAWATRSLHPTPAVCGLPTDKAKALILEKEKFNRGLYASYCGAVGGSGGELFVALRSASVRGNTVNVFAGAGLVLGSNPASEWKEINLKMSQYVRVLTSMTRPAISQDFPNATTAVSAIVVEEMLRLGVGAFCVCPGSRSTPLAVAIYRNTVSRAMTQVLYFCTIKSVLLYLTSIIWQVVHDERSAGFYALGCARAGVLCAVLVTSGTAVSNLLPSINEARESALPLLILTADRPAESRDVGEAQTIKQVAIFHGLLGWEKDFPPPVSEAVGLSASLISSILSDISFGVGEIAQRRGQTVHFNFQFRKNEINPEVWDENFPEKFRSLLPVKVHRWISSTAPYTRHSSLDNFFRVSGGVVSQLKRWVKREWRMWSVVMIVGELRSVREATDLRWMCTQLQIPCISDCISMMTSESAEKTSSECIFLGVDSLIGSSLFDDTLSSSIRLIVRVGGSMISAKLLDWMSKQSLASVLRVREDGNMDCRHDQTWVADDYLHASVSEFARTVTPVLMSSKVQDSTGQCAADVRPGICSALRSLRLAKAAMDSSLDRISADAVFSEPQVAKIIQEESNNEAPMFLSSSMACRDFDNYAGTVSATQGFRRVGCNRGANGIDGVISSAVGYAYSCSSKSTPLTLLIGDVATMHDISGIAIAAGVAPGSCGLMSVLGGGRVGKIVCVNNSGGGIFSFLPSAKYRDDFFSPFLDTPHNLNIASIAEALAGNSATHKCKRVHNAAELREALHDPDVFVIECVSLPNHVDNVSIHRRINNQLNTLVEKQLKTYVTSQLRWTYRHGDSTSSLTAPLLVMLHGWLGAESDWESIIPLVNNHNKHDVLTVSSGGDILSPSLFCHALRDIILGQQTVANRGVVFIGYSQGGRLAMHYRKLFPKDVTALVNISTSGGKQATTDIEKHLLDYYASNSNDLTINSFLTKWYSLSVFSDMLRRVPDVVELLIEKRVRDGLRVERALSNMVCSAQTFPAKAELTLVGALDNKYVALASKDKSEGQICEQVTVPQCGHNLLAEAEPDVIASPIRMLLESLASKHKETESSKHLIKIKSIDLNQFAVPMSPALSVLTGGVETIFDARRGVRVMLWVSVEDTNDNEGKDQSSAEQGISKGMGEIYEPVFSRADSPCSFLDVVKETEAVAVSLRGLQMSIEATASGVAKVINTLLASCSAIVRFGLEQCLVLALSSALHVPFFDCLGALMGQSKRGSHVTLNCFASMRGNVTVNASSEPPVKIQTNVLKMKIGDIDGTQAKADALRVTQYVQSSARLDARWLRLDANQSWSIPQAIEFAETLSDDAIHAIAYVEEPLRATEKGVGAYQELIRLCDRWSQITVALDETLSAMTATETSLLESSIVGTGAPVPKLVIKPALLSTSSDYLKRSDSVVTISCTFECGYTLAYLVCISAFFSDTPHGVHAKADMANVDDATRRFSQLPEEGGDDAGCLRIAADRAEWLLNELTNEYEPAGGSD